VSVMISVDSGIHCEGVGDSVLLKGLGTWGMFVVVLEAGDVGERFLL
jgi:hypothetical protein